MSQSENTVAQAGYPLTLDEIRERFHGPAKLADGVVDVETKRTAEAEASVLRGLEVVIQTTRVGSEELGSLTESDCRIIDDQSRNRLLECDLSGLSPHGKKVVRKLTGLDD